jgi:hypothetical protein
VGAFVLPEPSLQALDRGFHYTACEQFGIALGAGNDLFRILSTCARSTVRRRSAGDGLVAAFAIGPHTIATGVSWTSTDWTSTTAAQDPGQQHGRLGARRRRRTASDVVVNRARNTFLGAEAQPDDVGDDG